MNFSLSNRLIFLNIISESIQENKLLWRNWLARSAVNRKVGGSSPPGSDDYIAIGT